MPTFMEEVLAKFHIDSQSLWTPAECPDWSSLPDHSDLGVPDEPNGPGAGRPDSLCRDAGRCALL